MKFIHESGRTIEFEDPKPFKILLEREGFKPVEEENLEELRLKAKELGIKGYATMKAETLNTKIAEIE